MKPAKNLDKQLDLYKKLEAVLIRNESSVFDQKDMQSFKDNMTTPALESQATIEDISKNVDELGELTL